MFLFHNAPHIVRGGQAESLGAARSDLHLDTGAAQTQVLRPDLYTHSRRTFVACIMYLPLRTHHTYKVCSPELCINVPSMCIVQVQVFLYKSASNDIHYTTALCDRAYLVSTIVPMFSSLKSTSMYPYTHR